VRVAEWNDDSELIQKNTSIIVRRVPGQKAKTLTAPEPKAPGCARRSLWLPARRVVLTRVARRRNRALPEKRERIIAVRPTYGNKCVLQRCKQYARLWFSLRASY
jgi:hypothetical protein